MPSVYNSKLLVSGSSPLSPRRVLPKHWSPKQRRELCLKLVLYHIVDGVLFRKNYDVVFLRFLEQEDAKKVIAELHDGSAGGHFSSDTTTHKILRAGYYFLHYLRMLMLMLENVMLIKEVLEDKPKQPGL